MHLKITSIDNIIFDWEVENVNIPTEDWYIWIFPNHMPITSVVKAWLVKILPVEKKESMLEKWSFVFDDDKLAISVGKGLLFSDWNEIVMTVSSASSLSENTEEELSKMKEQLQKDIQQLKEKGGSIEDIEKSLMEYEKISADIKLKKISG